MSAVSQSSYQQTSWESAQGVIPTNKQYPPGNVMRYGAQPVPSWDSTAYDSYAAFQTAHDCLSDVNSGIGGAITIPQGIFYLSHAWEIDKQVTIRGAGYGQSEVGPPTILAFPEDSDGIRFFSNKANDEGGGHNSSSRSVLSDVFIVAQGSGTSGHGVHATSTITCERVGVRYFGGNGFHIQASSSAGTGEANLWNLYNCLSELNGGHGYFVDGFDVNAGSAFSCHSKQNGGWGYFDNSVLGNNYIGCHENGNSLGSWKTNNVDNATVLLGCYAEVWQHCGLELNNATVVIGGELGGLYKTLPAVTITGDGTGATARVGGRSAGVINYIQPLSYGSGYTTATVTIEDGTGSGATAKANIVGGRITSYTITNGGSGYAQSTPDFPRISDNGIGPVRVRKASTGVDGYLSLCSNKYTDDIMSLEIIDSTRQLQFLRWNPTKKTVDTYGGAGAGGAPIAALTRRIVHPDSTTETGGRSTVIPSSATEFPIGFWLEDGTNGRQITQSSAMPTTGEYAAGDFVKKRMFSISGNQGSRYLLLGWARITTGTAHVLDTDWVEAKVLIDSP